MRKPSFTVSLSFYSSAITRCSSQFAYDNVTLTFDMIGYSQTTQVSVYVLGG